MTSYWISDICVLFNSASINPFSGEDRNFRYNALTRLIILTTVVSAIFFKNFKDIAITGIMSLLISVLIYFATFNKDMNYKTHASLDAVEKNNETISSNFEKIKLSDENVNKKNLSMVRYRPGINTDNLSEVLFLKDRGVKKHDEINLEKYNKAPISAAITGSKVYNNATKYDINNEQRLSDITFTL